MAVARGEAESAATAGPRPPRSRALAAALAAGNRAWGNEVDPELSRWLAGAEVVVTGQQPGLLGGPLLSLVKACAVAAEVRRRRAAGREAVGFFWLATADDDLPEMGWARVAAGEQVLAAREDGWSRGAETAAAARLSGACAGLLAAVRERVPSEHGRAALDHAARCYLPGAALGDATARFLAPLLAGLGILEAMKSTRPGVMEYQVAAVARFTFLANGARFEGYNPIAGGGTNAWMGHYSRNLDPLKAGDMVLMDYAPDLRYYTSDVTRMWPVSGQYSDAQRTLARFILEYRQAFFRYIRPGVTPDEVLVRARQDMEGVLAKTRFASEGHRKAAEEMLTFRGHLQHPVGMTVHDPGAIWGKPFQEGVVFTVDPMMWIPDEKLYVRMEDTIVVTKDGIENLTPDLASTPEEIEAVMRQDGILTRVPRLP